MYLGRIVELAATREIFASPRHPYTRGLLSAVPRLAPGPKRAERLVQGEPPSAARLPEGCVFSSRCPHAEPACSTTEPTLEDAALAIRSPAGAGRSCGRKLCRLAGGQPRVHLVGQAGDFLRRGHCVARRPVGGRECALGSAACCSTCRRTRRRHPKSPSSSAAASGVSRACSSMSRASPAPSLVYTGGAAEHGASRPGIVVAGGIRQLAVRAPLRSRIVTGRRCGTS